MQCLGNVSWGLIFIPTLTLKYVLMIKYYIIGNIKIRKRPCFLLTDLSCKIHR